MAGQNGELCGASGSTDGDGKICSKMKELGAMKKESVEPDQW